MSQGNTKRSLISYLQPSMLRLFGSFRNIEKHILQVIIAEAFLQLVNAAFLIVLLIYMDKEGYSDYESTAFFKYRFIGVLALAYPLGLFIKGRRIKPFFYAASIGVPICSLFIVFAIAEKMDWLIYTAQIVWGVFFMFFQVSVLPYILRNARKDTHTEAISLSFSTWSLTTIVSGFLIFTLQNIDADFFSEQLLLICFCVISFAGFFFIHKINIKEELNRPDKSSDNKYDWGLIFKAIIPTILIAIGAGLTIPFISLFFYNVHGFDTDSVSLIYSSATVIVLFAVLATPWIKRKIGFERAIPLTQSVAIIMLVGLASTEFYAEFRFAAFVAVGFYLLRQPFMNVAGPMTSELTMDYVGKKNQELISALNASIWSGSWFFSGLVFQVLRAENVPYSTIFLITAAFYSIGVFTYVLLIRDYKKRKKLNLIEE